MQEWIKKEFNKELSIKTISYWCKKLGIKKKGRPSNIKKDEKKVKEFKEKKIKEIVKNNNTISEKFKEERIVLIMSFINLKIKILERY